MGDTKNPSPTPGSAKYCIAHSGAGNLPAFLVSARALEALRTIATASFSGSATASELGGLLIGRSAWKPSGLRALYVDEFLLIDTEHAHGPTFHPSQSDLTAFRSRLAVLAKEGREVLGWWRTDTRTDAFRFSAEDISLSSTLFGKAPRVDLVVRTERDKPLRALLRAESETYAASSDEFFFERDQMARTDTVDVPATPATPRPSASPAPASAPNSKPPVAPRTPETRLAAVPPVVAAKAASGSRRSLAVVAILLLCLVVVGLLAYQALRDDERIDANESTAATGAAADEARTPFQLTATRDGEGLRLEWDPASPALAGAQSGVLRIRDGQSESEVTLNGGDIASGSHLYMAQSADLRFDLEMHGPSGVAQATLQVLSGPLDGAKGETELATGPGASQDPTLADNGKPSATGTPVPSATKPAADRAKAAGKSTAANAKPDPGKQTAPPGGSATASWNEDAANANTPATANNGETNPAATSPAASGARPSPAPAETARAEDAPLCESAVSLVAYYEPRTAFGFFKSIPRAVGIGAKKATDSEDFRAPRLAKTPCPDMAGRRFVQRPENVVFLVEVSPDGAVTNVTPRGESAGTLISDYVRQTLRSWQFEPATVKEKAVRSEVEVRMKLHYPPSAYGAEGQ